MQSQDRNSSLESAFEQLVRKHKSSIYSVCYLFSNNTDEVADLFQEILINLWKGFPKFRNECQLETWIYRVSMNTCISADRKKKRQSQQVELSIDSRLFERQDSESRQVKVLYDRIHRLNLLDRAIVLLWLENLPYEEIGQIVGLSAKNISVRLVRIREQLKKA
ncbi:MAG: sigma-70 family RNA polymerase sigma factor [Bacteroidales bacterium]|nr:sigma-70 family RNA polymerase sigma factor [Bacteroidales bacterium]